MKNLNQVILLIFLFTIFACKKEAPELLQNSKINLCIKSDTVGYYSDSVYITSDSLIYSYYKDGIKQKASDCNPQINEGTEMLTKFIIVPVTNNGVMKGVNILEFTSDLGFESYGKYLCASFDKLMEFEAKVKTYVESNQVASEYERTGIIPDSFEVWFDREYNNAFSQPGFPVTVFDKLKGGPLWIYYTGYSPLMIGWNNKVSAYNHHTFYSNMFVYDRSFYRDRLAWLPFWGNNKIRFEGPLAWLDNKMSSFIGS